MTTAKLSRRTKAGFGICDLGGNLFFTAMGFWTLNYLTDTVLLPAAAAGFAVMIGKLWDAIIDPIIGFISDKTHSRFGRRRVYMLTAAIPLGLIMWYFFTNPKIENPALLTAWTAVILCLLNTAYSFINIPYSSLTPELTQDYHERTSLNSFRFGFAVVGTILGAAIVLPIVNHFPNRSTGFSMAGLAMGAIMSATALITFFSVKEPKHEDVDMPKENFFGTYLAVFRNRAYLIILFSYALNIVAINFLQGILVYYFKYVFNAEGLTTVAMIALLVVAMLCIPLSVPVSKRIGKRLTYQIGLGILAAVCVAIYFFGHALGMSFVIAMMVIGGIGLGLAYVAPWAMVPDTIEWDAVKTGNRKEGAYYGMWTFIAQCGQALSVGMSGLILNWGGYVAEKAQTPEALGAIRLIIGPIPAVIFAGGVLLLCAYPITEKVYNELMAGRDNPKD
jgi:GPH family glycoside/pentoside/hexuronide:cation symporter